MEQLAELRHVLEEGQAERVPTVEKGDLALEKRWIAIVDFDSLFDCDFDQMVKSFVEKMDRRSLLQENRDEGPIIHVEEAYHDLCSFFLRSHFRH